jgi:hypothetical protein
MLSGFNRGNVDWFHACALKRGIRSVESSYGDTWNKWPKPGDPRGMRDVSLGAEP